MSKEPAAPVRRVIRHKQTRLYLTRAGQWVKEPQAAENLAGLRDAQARCWRYQLRHAELVMQFEEPPLEEAVDLHHICE
jgi:hypothetical protein